MAKLSKKQLEDAHKHLKEDARQRIADRGVLQFRADPDTVLAVMEAAEEQDMPVGTLLRQWVQEKLSLKTTGSKKSPDLIQRITLLEAAVTDLQKKLK